jgi:ParB family chromosome partitioning protein
MPIEWLRPCAFQPRRHFEQDALEDLAKSIVMHGILQPIVVRPIADEKNSYEIIAGERRWRAAQLVQMHTVPVILQYLDDEAVMEVALIENLQREDLTPLEEARAFKKLMDIHGHTQEKLSVAVGKSRSYIANTLRLLNLPENVQSYVADGRLSAGHARSLIGRDNAEELAERIINEDLSVRAIEDLTKDKVKPSKTQNSNVDKDINTSALEEEMSRILGMQVSIQSGKKGNGSLKIKYSNFDQLDHLVHKLTKI